MQILVVACHPDDEVLGCGGVIRKHVLRGDTVRVLLLTDGATGRYGEELARSLQAGAEAAAAILGATPTFAGLPNQRLDALALTEVIGPIEEQIALFRPERLYVHHAGDLNKDHEVAARAALTAARPLPGCCVREILSYYVPSSSEWNAMEGHTAFHPTLYLDIADVLEDKLRAMACYPSEAMAYPHPRSLEALRLQAAGFGLQAGRSYAEPCRLLRRVSATP